MGGVLGEVETSALIIAEPHQAPATYARWLPVVLSFILPGAGPFFAGEKRAGIAWLLVLCLAEFLLVFCLASPLLSTAAPVIGAGVLMFLVWLAMLIKSYKPSRRVGARNLILVFILCMLVRGALGAIRVQWVRIFAVAGNSMSPTLRGDKDEVTSEPRTPDRIVLVRSAYWFAPPQRGDLIAFETDGLEQDLGGSIYMKRVVGLPGEMISIKNGQLFIDGKAVEDPPFATLFYTQKPLSSYLRSNDESFRIPFGHYFVLGDNSERSLDSRSFGPVAARNIIGKVTKIWWPPARFCVAK